MCKESSTNVLANTIFNMIFSNYYNFPNGQVQAICPAPNLKFLKNMTKQERKRSLPAYLGQLDIVAE